MRGLMRNRQRVWFVTPKESNDDITTVATYGKPEMKYLNVSATAGDVRKFGDGFYPEYDRYITSYDPDFLPEVGTMVFVDVVPEIGSDGYLAKEGGPLLRLDGTPRLDDYGNIRTDERYKTNPDYRVERVLHTQKGTVIRFMLKKV